jgi:hypothetical protein
MTRTDEAAGLDPSLRKVCLFVWAGALEGVDGAAAARQNQRMVIEHGADEAAVWQIAEFCDDHEAGLSGVHCSAACRSIADR